MVALYVMLGKAHLYCGEFQNENAAIRWYYMNRRSFQDNEGYYGEPVTVVLRRNHKRK